MSGTDVDTVASSDATVTAPATNTAAPPTAAGNADIHAAVYAAVADAAAAGRATPVDEDSSPAASDTPSAAPNAAAFKRWLDGLTKIETDHRTKANEYRQQAKDLNAQADAELEKAEFTRNERLEFVAYLKNKPVDATKPVKFVIDAEKDKAIQDEMVKVLTKFAGETFSGAWIRDKVSAALTITPPLKSEQFGKLIAPLDEVRRRGRGTSTVYWVEADTFNRG